MSATLPHDNLADFLMSVICCSCRPSRRYWHFVPLSLPRPLRRDSRMHGLGKPDQEPGTGTAIGNEHLLFSPATYYLEPLARLVVI